MKKILLLSLTLAPALLCNAATIWTIDNKPFNVDTLYHATVGPGITETELKVSDGTSTNNVFYTTVTLDNPYIKMRSAKAGNALRALETVPEIAERFNSDTETYIAGVNADFFNPGFPYYPLGVSISNGSLTNYIAPPQYADIDDYFLCFDPEGVPTFARHVLPAEQGTITFPNGTSYNHYVNKERGADQMILYSCQWQFHDTYNNTLHPAGETGVNQWGAEVAVMPVDDTVMWGADCKLQVIDNPVKYQQSMKIPQGGYVLSGHGAAIDYIINLKPGDIITASIGFTADSKPYKAQEVIGGFPYLIYNTTIQSTPFYPEHLANREPRTAVGHNADKSQLIMLVVDGRNAGGSAGVTHNMLAQYMKILGCTHAMNFDGGGSSTMYIDRLGVRNIPSTSSIDPNRPVGKPRTVVNALFAVSSAPKDNAIASIEIREKRVNLTTSQTYTPTVYGYNQYGVLIDTDVKNFTCIVSPLLGTLKDNTFTAGDSNMRGDFIVDYKGLQYSIPVYINGGTGEEVSASVLPAIIDNDNIPSPLYFDLMGRKVNNPAPGTIVIESSKSNSAVKLIK